MDSIDDQKTKFNEKVLEAQAKKGRNSRMLTREHYVSTVDRLKQLENPSEGQVQMLGLYHLRSYSM